MKFTSSLVPKLIYVFRINDATHQGCLKIGEATSDNENIFATAAEGFSSEATVFH